MTLSRRIILYGLLAAMTAGYLWIIRLGLGAFDALLTLEQASRLPILSRIAARNTLFWQTLAVVILFAGIAWSNLAKDGEGLYERHRFAALLQACWLLTCLLWHGSAVLAPFVMTVYIIK